MIVAILIIFAAAMSFSSTSRAADELVTVGAFSHGGEPEAGFDPINGWATTTEPLVQSKLFHRDNTSLKNDLAINYSVSSDGLTWTVKIRNDVKFTDGVPLTAKDVAFTFNKAANGTGGMDLSMLKNATALDDTTVQFKLNDPQSTFIYKLAGLGIVPEHAYNNETYGQNPIGSGPYKFVQWDKGQQVILERNDDYYGKKPYFRKLTILFMKTDAAFAAAKSGQVDLAEIPVSYANQTVNGMRTISIDSIDARGISLPVQADTGKKENNYTVGNNVTSDIAIRKALNVGIDRQALINGALNGQGVEDFTGVDRMSFGNIKVAFEDGNTDQAKKILADGGWKDTDSDGILEKNGTKAEFTLTYPSDDQTRQALAVSVSEEAKKLGIKINVEGKSWDQIDASAYSSPNVWGYGSIDPTDVYLRYYSNRGGSGEWSKYNNVIFYSNSAVDNNLRKAMTSFNKNTSDKYWKLAAWDGTTGYSEKGDAAWLWIATLKYVYVVKDDLDIGTPGLQPHGADLFNNIYDWKRINQTS